jgi:hypothetical protein
MDELIRAIGRLEGKVDGLKDGIDSVRESVSAQGKRIDAIEKDHWRAKGFIAAVSAIIAAAVTLITKGFVRVS